MGRIPAAAAAPFQPAARRPRAASAPRSSSLPTPWPRGRHTAYPAASVADAGPPSGLPGDELARLTDAKSDLGAALDPQKDLGVDRLRAGPSAEQTAKGSGEQDDEENKRDHRDPENEKILRPKYHTKNDKLSFQHIQHE